MVQNVNLENCPNCGGRWERICASDYEYSCDTCCMRLVDGVLISRDCECDEHKEGLSFVVERGENTLNLVEEALSELEKAQQRTIQEGEEFESIYIVDKLLKRNLISWDIYHLFISEERSCGFIPGVIKEGNFEFPFINCSDFYAGNLPKTPEDEMFFHIYSIINQLIKIKTAGEQK